jgi:transcriptional regulator with XRE-family HTH domain
MVVGMNLPPEDWQRLADHVRAARRNAGFATRRALAKATGITERTLGKLEHGERVSSDTLDAVAKAVGWPPGAPRLILAGANPEPARVQEPPRLAAVPGPGTLPDDPTDDQVEQLILAEEPFTRRDMLWKAWRLMGADRRTRLELLRVLLAPPPDVREDREEWQDTGHLTGP